MKVITNPFFDDPMYNKSFSELGFEYDKNGTVLTPWINQFPNPIKYSTKKDIWLRGCLLYTSPSPRDVKRSRMPSSA